MGEPAQHGRCLRLLLALLVAGHVEQRLLPRKRADEDDGKDRGQHEREKFRERWVVRGSRNTRDVACSECALGLPRHVLSWKGADAVHNAAPASIPDAHC